MALGVWLIVAWMVFMVVIGVVLFAWGWRSGQFRDVESSKRAMLCASSLWVCETLAIAGFSFASDSNSSAFFSAGI